MKKQRASILLSTDTLGGYGLDHIFEIAKEAWFEGIDLATRKNYDAWNKWYVKKLTEKHDLPVNVIQVSDKVNKKEMEQAFELCDELSAKTITINAPKLLDFRTYNFLITNLRNYKHEGVKINFAIINPNDANFFALPIPKFRFKNIAEIVKKYNSLLWLDIANLDEETLEIHFLNKIKNYMPHIAVVYFSDKSKKGEDHIAPGEGILKLPSILKKLKENKYNQYISVKLNLPKKYLSDNEKVLLILSKAVKYLQEYYIDLP